MERQDKKEVRLKTLFDAESRRKRPCPSVVSLGEMEETMEEAGASPRTVHQLWKVLKKEGFIQKDSRDFDLAPKTRRYVQERRDRCIRKRCENKKRTNWKIWERKVEERLRHNN